MRRAATASPVASNSAAIMAWMPHAPRLACVPANAFLRSARAAAACSACPSCACAASHVLGLTAHHKSSGLVGSS